MWVSQLFRNLEFVFLLPKLALGQLSPLPIKELSRLELVLVILVELVLEFWP
jgi:hypothetical protein